MKQFGAEAGGRTSLPSWARRLASTVAVAAFALIAASSAEANVETFSLSGDLNTFGAPVVFSGSMKVNFSDDWSSYEAQSITISVQGRQSVFDVSPFVVLGASKTGTIQASDSSKETLTLLFATPPSGGWAGFTTETIFFGDVVVGGLTGSLFGATGAITRISGPPIPVPELSTWAMMLVGLAGLGLAARRGRAFKLPGWRRLSGPPRAS